MITPLVVGTFNPDISVIGTTDSNEYFPFYALIDTEHNYYEEQIMEQIIGNVSSYCKPSGSHRTWSVSGYPNLFKALTNQLSAKLYVFKNGDDVHEVSVGKGFIMDDNNDFLMLLTTNEDISWNEMIEKGYSNLRLYLSSDFITNPIYRNLYKKMTTDYLSEFFKLGIEVVFIPTKEIEKRCFSNAFQVEFDSLQELDEHLNSGLGVGLIRTEDEATLDRRGWFGAAEAILDPTPRVLEPDLPF